MIFNADGIEDGLLLSLPNCRCDYLGNILLEHNLILGVYFVWGSDEHDVYVNICLIQKWCSCCEMLRVGKWLAKSSQHGDTTANKKMRLVN
jgi:hypothetical protein